MGTGGDSNLRIGDQPRLARMGSTISSICPTSSRTSCVSPQFQHASITALLVQCAQHTVSLVKVDPNVVQGCSFLQVVPNHFSADRLSCYLTPSALKAGW